MKKGLIICLSIILVLAIITDAKQDDKKAFPKVPPKRPPPKGGPPPGSGFQGMKSKYVEPPKFRDDMTEKERDAVIENYWGRKFDACQEYTNDDMGLKEALRKNSECNSFLHMIPENGKLTREIAIETIRKQREGAKTRTEERRKKGTIKGGRPPRDEH